MEYKFIKDQIKRIMNKHKHLYLDAYFIKINKATICKLYISGYNLNEIIEFTFCKKTEKKIAKIYMEKIEKYCNELNFIKKL